MIWRNLNQEKPQQYVFDWLCLMNMINWFFAVISVSLLGRKNYSLIQGSMGILALRRRSLKFKWNIWLVSQINIFKNIYLLGSYRLLCWQCLKDWTVWSLSYFKTLTRLTFSNNTFCQWIVPIPYHYQYIFKAISHSKWILEPENIMLLDGLWCAACDSSHTPVPSD